MPESDPDKSSAKDAETQNSSVNEPANSRSSRSAKHQPSHSGMRGHVHRHRSGSRHPIRGHGRTPSPFHFRPSGHGPWSSAMHGRFSMQPHLPSRGSRHPYKQRSKPTEQPESRVEKQSVKVDGPRIQHFSLPPEAAVAHKERRRHRKSFFSRFFKFGVGFLVLMIVVVVFVAVFEYFEKGKAVAEDDLLDQVTTNEVILNAKSGLAN